MEFFLYPNLADPPLGEDFIIDVLHCNKELQGGKRVFFCMYQPQPKDGRKTFPQTPIPRMKHEKEVELASTGCPQKKFHLLCKTIAPLKIVVGIKVRGDPENAGRRAFCGIP